MKKIFIIIFLSFILIGCEPAQKSQATVNLADIQGKTLGQELLEPLGADADVEKEAESNPESQAETGTYYEVVKVVDGDTIDVNINGRIERIRLIGIDTPETVDPRKPVECFGREASDKLKALLAGKKVILEADPSQGDKDKYGRLLRFVFTESGINIGDKMIREGYAYEYTYSAPYKYQELYKRAQKVAQANKAGLWADGACGNTENNAPVSADAPAINAAPDPAPAPAEDAGDCVIKGNISSSGEKIYHVPGCASYNATVITASKGERCFLTEDDALKAGWRKALNCPK